VGMTMYDSGCKCTKKDMSNQVIIIIPSSASNSTTDSQCCYTDSGGTEVCATTEVTSCWSDPSCGAKYPPWSCSEPMCNKYYFLGGDDETYYLCQLSSTEHCQSPEGPTGGKSCEIKQ
jgi:hypothetical protein